MKLQTPHPIELDMHVALGYVVNGKKQPADHSIISIPYLVQVDFNARVDKFSGIPKYISSHLFAIQIFLKST